MKETMYLIVHIDTLIYLIDILMYFLDILMYSSDIRTSYWNAGMGKGRKDPKAANFDSKMIFCRISIIERRYVIYFLAVYFRSARFRGLFSGPWKSAPEIVRCRALKWGGVLEVVREVIVAFWGGGIICMYILCIIWVHWCIYWISFCIWCVFYCVDVFVCSGVDVGEVLIMMGLLFVLMCSCARAIMRTG